MWGIVMGVGLQLQQPQLWSWRVYLGLAVAAVCGWWWLWRRPWCCQRGAVWLIAVVLGLSYSGGRALWLQRTAMPAQWEGKDVRVQGVITSLPQASERGVRMEFAIEKVLRAPDTAQPTGGLALPPQVTLHWYGDVPEQGLKAGQRWAWTVRLKAPHGSLNPHGMDWELWLWSQGIQATGYVRQGAAQQAPQWMAQTARAPLAQWRGKVHARMHPPQDSSAQMHRAYGVVQALVTGAQSSIHSADWQLFRDTGVAHLVSISGLHITMFAWLAIAVVGAAWRCFPKACLWCPAPVAGAWAGLALAAAYAAFSGWGVPAQRTVGMLAVVVWLRSRGRQWPWPAVWLLVLTVVVLLDPWSLLQAGFWLSFVAVGVLFAAQPREPIKLRGWRRWREALQRLLREQSIIGLALAPLTLLLFGQISVVGLVANVWAIPWVTLVITPLSMLGVLWPALWTAAAHGVAWMTQGLQAMADWPVAVVHFAQPPWWAAAAGVCGCLWLAMPWPWRWRVLGLPWVWPMLLWQSPGPAFGQFEVLALDVGQGSAVLVRTQHHSLLFDAGPRWSEEANAGERVVVPTLRALGVQPHAVIISHADGDHSGGAGAVQAAFPQAKRWGDGGAPCQAGQQWAWDGVHMQILHPFEPVASGQRTGNADSCVLQVVSSSGVAALLTGDIGVAQEQALLKQYPHLQAHWLQVPHHGSRSSSSPAWVAQLAPHVAVVQAGYLNRFGHPHPQVEKRYVQAGALWLATPQCGAALWRSVAPDVAQCTRDARRRYWHR